MIFITVLITSTFSFTYVSAYSASTTHPALTDEIVDFYNYHYPQTMFRDSDKRLIVQGSTDEDAPVVRVLNHFYDPVRNIGLLHVNFTAKTWVKSTKKQAAFSGNLLAGVSESLFSEDDEYSWERSVYEYVHGDKKRALLGLGHALHMIEDMTVPPHTRNDQHLSIVDESPYEDWASKFTPENITIAESLIAEGKSPKIRSSIDEYMSNLSFFTNNNFFSKDTLPFSEAVGSSIPKDRYPIPKYSVVGVGLLLDDEMQSFGVSRVNGVSYKLFELRGKKTKRNDELSDKRYRINQVDEEESVLSDYWDILSEQAVLNGAGVVKLFFDEVEKEKETLALYYKNQSWLDKFLPKWLARQYSKGDLTPLKNLAAVYALFEETEVENVQEEDIAEEEILKLAEEMIIEVTRLEGMSPPLGVPDLGGAVVENSGGGGPPPLPGGFF